MLPSADPRVLQSSQQHRAYRKGVILIRDKSKYYRRFRECAKPQVPPTMIANATEKCAGENNFTPDSIARFYVGNESIYVNWR